MSLPPQEIPLGAMRFNSDSQKLEYWNGGAWFQIHTFSPNLDGGARGLFGGGATPSNSDVIDFVTISTAGNATDFGDLTDQRQWVFGAASSRVRGVWTGGFSPSISDIIDFVTISSTGSATDFGNLLDSRGAHAGCINETRGVFGGGNPETSSNKTDGIEFITIASTGNGVDFGDLMLQRQVSCGTASPLEDYSWVVTLQQP